MEPGRHAQKVILEDSTMPYVDGYLIPIPNKNLAAYRRLAQKASKVWKDYGALEFRECAGDDLAAKSQFRKMAKLKPGETLVFSWVVYKSRADRDRVNAKVLKDPRIAKMMTSDMPFDPKRMAYGGFKVLVDA
jgi:uncharacterized protein YbaA (DUF1428 family)